MDEDDEAILKRVTMQAAQAKNDFIVSKKPNDKKYLETDLWCQYVQGLNRN